MSSTQIKMLVTAHVTGYIINLRRKKCHWVVWKWAYKMDFDIILRAFGVCFAYYVHMHVRRYFQLPCAWNRPVFELFELDKLIVTGHVPNICCSMSAGLLNQPRGQAKIVNHNCSHKLDINWCILFWGEWQTYTMIFVDDKSFVGVLWPGSSI